MWSKSKKKFIIACKILLIDTRARDYDTFNKINYFSLNLNVFKVNLWGKTLKCSWKLTFWLDTASSMLIFVDWKTSHTFFMFGTIYPMKRCEPSHWAATIYHEMKFWGRDSAKAMALKKYRHYSV